MTLNASGNISFGGSRTGESINLELGNSATAQVSINDSGVRTLLAVASGQIDLNTARGKANSFAFNKTISANTTDYNLATDMTSNGWNGTSKVNATVTINSGIYVYASTTSTYGFTVSGIPSQSTISIINNGFILGKGGAGGTGGAVRGTAPGGGNGGTAFYTNYAVSITNNGTIGGGGGGGGGGGLGVNNQATWAGAGGGGGGRPNGAAGGPSPSNYWSAGSPGSAGSLTGNGGGGRAGYQGNTPVYYWDPWGNGGAGGGLGSSGGGGYTGFDADLCGPGGPYGYAGGPGGSAGAATVGNANITWVVTGTRSGTLS